MNSKIVLELGNQVEGIYYCADFVHLLGINVLYMWKLLKQDAK